MEIGKYLDYRKKIMNFIERTDLKLEELELILILGEKGLTPSGVSVFDIQKERLVKGSIGNLVKELNQLSPVRQSTISGYIKNLRLNGFITKQMHPHEERLRYIELTEEGEKIYRDVQKELDEI